MAGHYCFLYVYFQFAKLVFFWLVFRMHMRLAPIFYVIQHASPEVSLHKIYYYGQIDCSLQAMGTVP